MRQLDSLRAFAVFLVLAAHTLNTEALPWGLSKVPVGEFGVQLFFVLSGFLITRILLDCRDVREAMSVGWWLPVRQFYARRFLRIFPLYYGVIAAALVVGIRDASRYWPWLISYTFNIYLAHTGEWVSYFSHFWSLAVEEQFYLVWPWLVVFCPKKWLPATLGGMILMGPIWRAVALGFGANHIAAYCLTPACLDALGAGSLLSVFSRSQQQWNWIQTALRRSVFWILLLSIFLLLQVMRGKSGGYHVALRSATAFIFMALISTSARGFKGIPRRILENSAVRYIGKISYGIYVFHPFTATAARWMARSLGHEMPFLGLTTFLAASVTTIAVAATSWTLFEKPLNDLKKLFPYNPRPARMPLYSQSRTTSS